MIAHVTSSEFPLLLVILSVGIGVGIGIGAAWALRVLQRRRTDR